MPPAVSLCSRCVSHSGSDLSSSYWCENYTCGSSTLRCHRCGYLCRDRRQWQSFLRAIVAAAVYGCHEPPRRSYGLPEAPRSSSRRVKLPEAPGTPQALPEAPRGSQKLPETPRGSRRLPDTPTGSQKPPEAPRGSLRLPDAPDPPTGLAEAV